MAFLCIRFHVVFGSAFPWTSMNQRKYFQTAMQYGERMRKCDVATRLQEASQSTKLQPEMVIVSQSAIERRRTTCRIPIRRCKQTNKQIVCLVTVCQCPAT